MEQKGKQGGRAKAVARRIDRWRIIYRLYSSQGGIELVAHHPSSRLIFKYSYTVATGKGPVLFVLN